jgi:hypothetical protein
MTFMFKAIAVLTVSAVSALAHEYPLQFTAAAGARGLVVAGYQITGATVTGTCSYYTVTSGSGRGGGYHTITTPAETGAARRCAAAVHLTRERSLSFADYEMPAASCPSSA